MQPGTYAHKYRQKDKQCCIPGKAGAVLHKSGCYEMVTMATGEMKRRVVVVVCGVDVSAMFNDGLGAT